MNLKEIATQAQVSSATVSMVLHGRSGVKKETRTKIEQLLRENGYTIGTQGEGKRIRFLKYSNRSYLVDDNPGFVSALIDAIERECRRVGHDLMITAFRPKSMAEVFGSLERDPPDGIILLGTEWTPDDCRYLQGLRAPLVVVDNNLTGLPYHCVTGNQTESMYAIVSHLYELGHRRIGYVMNTSPSCNCRESMAGFEAAMHAFSLTPHPDDIFLVQPTFLGAYASMKEHLAQGREVPTALVTNNDNLALGVMKAIKEGGLRIPEDVSVVGTDNISAAAMADPPLTTMDPGCKQLGIWAVRLLRDLMDYPDSPITKIRVTSRMVERASTGPCRG